MSLLSPSPAHRFTGPQKPVRIGACMLPALLLGLLLPLTSVACMQPPPGQTASQESRADSTKDPKPRPRHSARASRKPDGRWHHFGENASPSTQPQPSPAPGLWHHFGSADSAPRSNASPDARSSADVPTGQAAEAPPPPAAPRSTYGANRITDLERRMLTLINRDRRDAGVRPLRWNARLAAVARAHSRDMVGRSYFSHDTPGGKSVGARVTAAGIDWEAVGENIAIAPTISRAETEFMNEPRHQQNHRWNILNPDYAEVGVGIVQGSNGQLYITQDFIKGVPGR